jgi:beta propeller repeat protein
MAISPSITPFEYSPGFGYEPAISGYSVVASTDDLGAWGEPDIGPTNIFGFGILGGGVFSICAADGIQEAPDIYSHDPDIWAVVWADNRSGDFDVYSYRIVDDYDPSPLVAGAGDQRFPRIGAVELPSGVLECAVVWQDARDEATSGLDIYGWTESLGTFPICTRSGNQSRPDIWGNMVVWADSRNGNSDIYKATFAPSTGAVTESRICTNNASQTLPAVDGNWIAWIDSRSGRSSVYGYNLRTSSEFLIDEPPYQEPDDYQAREVDVSGHTAVWTDDSEGAGGHLRGMNLKSGQKFLIGQNLDDGIRGPRVDGRSTSTVNVVACDYPRTFGDILGVAIGWGMELEVAGAPDWVTDPALDLHVAAATPDSWVTDMRYSSEGRLWTAWRDYTTTGSYVLPAGEGRRTVSAQFRDEFGDISPTTQTTVGLDTQPPASGHDADGTWRSTDQAVHLVASDATSGVSRSEYRVDADATWHAGDTVAVAAPQDHSADGTHTIRYRSVDVAGNVEQAKTCQVRIDTTAPTTTDNADDAWHKAAYELVLTPSDAHSGVQETEYRVDGGAWQRGVTVSIASDGVHGVDYRSTDAAGNVESVKTCEVRTDGTAPVTSCIALSGWQDHASLVTLSATDASSGIDFTEYRLDSGAWTRGTSVNVTGNGAHNLAYRSIDKAGNMEAAGSRETLVDAAPPTTTASGYAGWHREPVAVTFDALDSGIGVKQTWYRVDGGSWLPGTSVHIGAPDSHANDGSHRVQFYSVDEFGHRETTKSCAVRVDTRVPSVRVLSGCDNRSYPHAIIRYRVEETASPDVDVTITVNNASGSVVKSLTLYDRTPGKTLTASFRCTLSPRNYTLHVSAADRAGNVGAARGTLRVYVWWRDAASYKGKVKTVLGPAKGTQYAYATSGQPTFINMGNVYTRTPRFTALIWGRDRHHFGFAPEARYRGHLITVSGKITIYRGQPQVFVSYPTQMHILK